VVVAMRDPNPITNGRGLARLRRAGVRVSLGVCEEAAQQMNAPFTTWVTRQRPWMVAKVAQSLDGKIATRTGTSRWISSPEARRLVHRLRGQVDAVMVGAETVRRDDPRLTARTERGGLSARQPRKVIVDSRLRLSLSSRCFPNTASPAPTIVATTPRGAKKRRLFEQRGVTVVTLPATADGRVPLGPLCRTLAKQFLITSVLLEGGGELIASALQARLVDRLLWVTAPILLGGRESPSSVGGAGVTRINQAIRLRDVQVRRLGPDVLVDAAVVYPKTVHSR
jgi:diaminohydroxyphosphoribosylaminopyrimidine deaminase/5-amino-6-(5-phosphoribosylamino)uracil reductase